MSRYDWMRDDHPTLGSLVPPIDPDREELRDQRIGNWIVVLAYGVSGVLLLGGLIALAIIR